MKFTAALSAFVVLAAQARAEFKIPEGVWPADHYDDAVKQAQELKKPLAVVEGPDAKDGKDFSRRQELLEEAFKVVKDWTVVVYVQPKDGTSDISMLPPPAMQALVDASGVYPPRIAIFSPTEDFVWKIAGLPKKFQQKEVRKLFRESVADVKLKVTAYFATKTPPPPSAPPTDVLMRWGRAEGGTYGGKFVKVEDEKLHVIDKDGKAGVIPFKDLKPATIRYLKFISSTPAADSAPSAAPATKPAAVMEKWMNNQGKVIEAAFVSLTDNKLTLRTPAGKEYTLALDSLALTSQVRAKELAAKTDK